MDDRDHLESVADKYRREGYDVLIRPSAEDLPVFFGNDPIDILAHKGDHIVALKVKDRGDSQEEPVRVAADLGRDYAARLLEEVEMLLHPQTRQSALVMGWAAFEAAARNSLQPGKTAFAATNPRQLIEELLNRGLISEEESSKLLECLYLRNALAHGVRPEDLPQDSVSFLLRLARRLLQTTAGSGGIGFSGFATVGVHRGISQSPKIKNLVEQATRQLVALLGPSRGSVSYEWDVAEDAKGRQVLVLKLSDLTGMVAATFDPSELEDPARMQSRLNRLWGDLLEIQSAPAGSAITGRHRELKWQGPRERRLMICPS